MHAQTILQLYRQLLSANYDDAALAEIRAAYELARQLFVGCYRPSEKPFCAHLVGTASALARWGERTEMVAAGLLHSAYLYGEFGDRSRGFSHSKQQVVVRNVGLQTEALVDQYTESTELTLSLLDQQSPGPQSRDIIALKLADLYDECADGGPCYSPHKPLAGGLADDLFGRREILALAERWIGPAARADLARVFHEIDTFHVPAVLVNEKRAYHTAQPGVPELRVSQMRRRLLRFAQRLSLW